MLLPNQTPIETPAVAAKTYDKLHLYSLTAIQPTGGSGSITVELLPATADGELATGDNVQRMCPARFIPRLQRGAGTGRSVCGSHRGDCCDAGMVGC
jgi:hypothetical protein